MPSRKLGFQTTEEPNPSGPPPTYQHQPTPPLYKPNPDPRTPGFLAMVVNSGMFEVYTTPFEFRIAGPNGSLVVRPGAEGDLHVAYEPPFAEPTILLYKGCAGEAIPMSLVRAITPEAPGSMVDNGRDEDRV